MQNVQIKLATTFHPLSFTECLQNERASTPTHVCRYSVIILKITTHSGKEIKSASTIN